MRGQFFQAALLAGGWNVSKSLPLGWAWEVGEGRGGPGAAGGARTIRGRRNEGFRLGLTSSPQASVTLGTSPGLPAPEPL